MIVIRNTCALNSREIHNAVTQPPVIWQSLGLALLQVKKKWLKSSLKTLIKLETLILVMTTVFKLFALHLKMRGLFFMPFSRRFELCVSKSQQVLLYSSQLRQDLFPVQFSQLESLGERCLLKTLQFIHGEQSFGSYTHSFCLPGGI